jgi:hypothetical protein
MLIIVWNPQEFHLVNVLPKECKFNTDYYITELLSTFSDWRLTQKRRIDRKLLFNTDNTCQYTVQASTDFLEAHGMEKAPHSPYSPDRALSDVDIFGHVKNRLAGASFADADELLEAMMTILGEIEKVALEAIFLE